MAKIGALFMAFGAHPLALHGGIFVLLIPNAVNQLLLYVLAIAGGTIVTAGMLFIVKKSVAEANGQLADTQTAAA